MLHDRRFAADHQAIASLATPDSAAGPDVDVVNALLDELLGATDVVDIIGIAAVDEDVARREVRYEVGDGRVHRRGRDHEPKGSWRLQLLHEVRDRRGADRFGPGEFLDRLRGPVEHHALMAAREQAMDHVRAHAAKSDHSELHISLLCNADRPAASVSPASPMAVRRRRIATATPSRSLKIAEPATSTVAPARTTSGAVSASIPPSTSTSHRGWRRSTSSRARPIFGNVVVMNC